MGLFSTIGNVLGIGGGDLFGGLISGLGASEKQSADKASSARQMAFQERMSNTAHQRQMKDLKRSGINPMLSAKLGGASSPSGSQYQATNIGAEAVKGGLAGAQATNAKNMALMSSIDAKAAQQAGLSPNLWTPTAKNLFLAGKFGSKAALTPYSTMERTSSARGMRGLSAKEKLAVQQDKNRRQAKKKKFITPLGDATLHGTYSNYKFKRRK